MHRSGDRSPRGRVSVAIASALGLAVSALALGRIEEPNRSCTRSLKTIGVLPDFNILQDPKWVLTAVANAMDEHRARHRAYPRTWRELRWPYSLPVEYLGEGSPGDPVAMERAHRSGVMRFVGNPRYAYVLRSPDPDHFSIRAICPRRGTVFEIDEDCDFWPREVAR